MKRKCLTGVALIGCLAFASMAFAETTIITQPQPQSRSTTVVVTPQPAHPVGAAVGAVVQSLTQPDCDVTKKTVEGPRKTTTTVTKDC